MATPILKMQTTSLRSYIGAKGVFSIPAQLADGTAVDMSSGYTFRTRQRPASNANSAAAAVTDSAAWTLVGGDGEVVVTLGIGNPNDFPTLNTAVFIEASNDAGSTFSALAQSTLTLLPTAVSP